MSKGLHFKPLEGFVLAQVARTRNERYFTNVIFLGARANENRKVNLCDREYTQLSLSLSLRA